MGEAGGTGIVNEVIAALESPLAIWIYAWVGIAIAFISSTAIAVTQLGITRSFQAGDVLRTFKGRPPKKDAAIQGRIEEMTKHAKNVLRSLLKRSAYMVIFGIVFPGLLLALIAWYQSWLLPGDTALSVEGLPSATRELTGAQLSMFIADQALRGGLSDLFEVFGFSLGSVTNNPDNIWFSSLVLAYRFLCGAIVLGIIYMVVRVGLGLSTLRSVINDLANDAPSSNA